MAPTRPQVAGSIPAPATMGLFGTATHPSEATEWERATGIRPDFLAVFEHWVNQETPEADLGLAAELGYRRFMVTWEPWDPAGSRASQPKFSAEAILRGDHDAYIKAFADAVRISGMDEVFIRFAHEMNGDWYPWARDPQFVQAWIRVRLLFRQRNAFNAKWLWSPNADLYRDRPSWLQTVLPYWPGGLKVDYVGLTTINFGAPKSYPWFRFADRLQTASYVFEKAVLSAEMNVAFEERERWFEEMALYAGRPERPLHFTCLSQGESYAAATMETGNLAWSVTDDAPAQDGLRSLVEALHR